MHRHQPYDHIKAKLEQYSARDTDALWQDMSAILDREMPVEKDRKPLWWLFTRNGIILSTCTVGFITISLLVTNHSKTLASADYNQRKQILLKESGRRNTSPINNDVTVVTPTKKFADTTKAPVTGPPLQLPVAPGADVAALPAQDISLSPVRNSDIMENGPAQKIQNNTISSSLKQITPVAAAKAVTKAGKNVDQEGTQKEVLVFDQEKTKDQEGTTELEGTTVSINSKETETATPVVTDKQELPITRTLIDAHNVSVKRPDMSRQLDGNMMNRPTIPVPATVEAIVPRQKLKCFVAGASINVLLPVSSQEMSKVSYNGESGKAIDYLPSLHAQYYLNPKLFVQTEIQFTSPQYTPQLMLARKMTDVNGAKKTEQSVQLNKLYYLNIPFSVHYSPVKNLYIGTGIQYSRLTRTVYTDEQATWEKRSGDWKKTNSNKKVAVANPAKVKKEHKEKTNGNNSNPGQPPLTETLIDTMAMSFRTTDWRFLADAHYQWKRFNVGLRYNAGLNNYISTEAGSSMLQVQDRNESFQLYLRYNLVDLRRKKF
jgi:hypothetical protein